MKPVYIVAIVTVITAIMLLAAPPAEAVSNAAVLYLRVAAGARPAGMGEAFVSIADDATATYWNPAGLGNAPIAGKLETKEPPPGYGEITDAVTLPGIRSSAETWVIAGNRLVVFDGTSWGGGKVYPTSSDQTIIDFVKTILNTDDQTVLRSMADQVVAANSVVADSEISAFAQSVRSHLPKDYAAMGDLERGLDTLAAGYHACLLNTERFRALQGKLAEGLKDSTLTPSEADRITFSLEQALLRFLPSRLEVPYSAGIVGNLTCLGVTGKYVWVGTDKGLYRRSGASWARYSVGAGLPSDTVLVLAGNGDQLLIGTARGLGDFLHGTFATVADLPAVPVTAVSFDSPSLGYAAIDGVIYRFDGTTWSSSVQYTVRIDDTIDKIADRIGVYRTPSEREYLIGKIREMNSAGAAPAAVVPADSTGSAVAVDPGAAAVVDSTLLSKPTPPAVADTTADEANMPTPPETSPGASPIDAWLAEGNVIRVPLSPRLPYDVTALRAGIGVVWVGTSGGLLSYDGRTWSNYGYTAFMVPQTDSAGNGGAMTAMQIAQKFMPMGDTAKVAVLAANIDEYNEMNGQPAAPGSTVYVYSHNTGSAIHSIGSVFGDLYIGTEYSTEKKTSSGWEPVSLRDAKHSQLVAAYDYAGEAYFVSGQNITFETKGRKEFVAMFVKWLPTLDVDMYYGFASYVHNTRGVGTFGLSFVYLNYGTIEFRDEAGNPRGEGHPFELTVAGSYGTSLNSKLKLGGTVKFIHSHLSEVGAGQERGEGIASAFAVDAGILYRITDRMQFGSALTNLGPDIKYVDAAQSDPLPRNLALGLSYKVWDTPYNRIVVQGELNKMLTGLNKGIGREFEYAIRHIGAEYWYSNFIALRAGYVYDKEGEVKHITFGAGLQYSAARFDLAYIPSSVDSPLANTLRIAFSLMF